jgi:hypothetical protein
LASRLLAIYPDGGRALITWANRNRINAALLESYTSIQIGDQWNDFVAVFLKDDRLISAFPKRILDTKGDVTNGLRFPGSEFLKFSQMPEDRKKLLLISQIITNQIKAR